MELFPPHKETLFISFSGSFMRAAGRGYFFKLAESWGPVTNANLKMALAHYGQEIRYHGVNLQPSYQMQIIKEIHC